MNEHDEIPEDVAYLELVFNGVTHRVAITRGGPALARGRQGGRHGQGQADAR
jgi:hypothetical protein